MAEVKTSFFESGTFYLILWILCGLSYFIYRKKHKAEDEENRRRAAEVNKESLAKIEEFKKKLNPFKKEKPESESESDN